MDATSYTTEFGEVNNGTKYVEVRGLHDKVLST